MQRLICAAAFRYKLLPVNADFTGVRQIDRTTRGKSPKGPMTMSSRHDICAIERTAGNAGAAASLILGTLLLLIRP